jgi:hypothetical protein
MYLTAKSTTLNSTWRYADAFSCAHMCSYISYYTTTDLSYISYYTTTDLVGLLIRSWSDPGGKLPVAKVTRENWWSCFAKINEEVVTAEVAAMGKSMEWMHPYTATETNAVEVSFRAGGTTDPTNTSSGVFGNEFVEAPAMFKRKGLYYALFGNCCCFCGHGSGIGVYTAAHPLGPYTYHDNVGCGNTTLTPGCGCGMNHNTKEGKCNNYGKSLTKAQQNFVIQIPQADGSKQLVWTGDMWQSAKDGIKAHDLQYWSVLDFQTVGGIDLPVQFTWQDEIQINV